MSWDEIQARKAKAEGRLTDDERYFERTQYALLIRAYNAAARREWSEFEHLLRSVDAQSRYYEFAQHAAKTAIPPALPPVVEGRFPDLPPMRFGRLFGDRITGSPDWLPSPDIDDDGLEEAGDTSQYEHHRADVPEGPFAECPPCGGTGRREGTCPRCHGAGYIND